MKSIRIKRDSSDSRVPLRTLYDSDPGATALSLDIESRFLLLESQTASRSSLVPSLVSDQVQREMGVVSSVTVQQPWFRPGAALTALFWDAILRKDDQSEQICRGVG